MSIRIFFRNITALILLIFVAISASAQTTVVPLSINENSSGQLEYKVTFSEQRNPVQLFARKNSAQHLAPMMSETNNGDGTWTYSYGPDTTSYTSGDAISARVYSAIGGAQYFNPGPGAASWSDALIYGQGSAQPSASFVYSCADLICSFDASASSGNNLSYSWSFGDGSSANGVSPSHTYSAYGSYSVSLTVSDSDSNTDLDTQTVTLASNLPPSADFNVSCTNLSCSFDGAASQDSDGSITSYTWDFGDGASGSGVSVSHTFSAEGSFNVSLDVSDDDGATDTYSQSVDVSEAIAGNLIISFNPSSNKVEYSVTFSEQHSSVQLFSRRAPNGYHIASQPMSETNNGNGSYTYEFLNDNYAYSIGDTIEARVWSLKDGQQDYMPGPSASDHQQWSYATVPPNDVPVANFSFQCPSSATSCDFDGSSSSDSDGSITSYLWDFGDGNSASGVSPSHTYTSNGNYTVTLTVTDDGGSNGDNSQTVSVNGPTPTPTPVPDFAYTPGADSITFYVNDSCSGASLNYGINAASSSQNQDMFSAPASNDNMGAQVFTLSGMSAGDVVNFNFISCNNSDELSYTFPNIVPLFDASTPLEPEQKYFDTNGYLVTEVGDRVRIRHTKGSHEQFFLDYKWNYFEKRTAKIKVIDEFNAGGNTVHFEVITQAPLTAVGRELRQFFKGRTGKLSEWYFNPFMIEDSLFGTQTSEETGQPDVKKFTYTISYNERAGRALQLGDVIEIEPNYDMDAATGQPGGHQYYLSIWLYKVGTGFLSWDVANRQAGPDSIMDTSDDVLSDVQWGNYSGNPDPSSEIQWDSVEITDPERLLGGETTTHANVSGEDHAGFLQMANNIAAENARPFVRGRRVHHTSFVDGGHFERTFSPDLPNNSTKGFPWADGKMVSTFANDSCEACHVRNSAAAVPGIGENLDGFIVKIAGADGLPEAARGSVLQPKRIERDTNGDMVRWAANNKYQRVNPTGWNVPKIVESEEGSVSIASIDESYGDGRRSFSYSFSAGEPARYSVRIAPRLVALGLKEAVKESDILANEAAQSGNLSGRVRSVIDPETGDLRIGRFGWKGGEAKVKHQIAAALRNDMGIPNSVYDTADCGSAQLDCAPDGNVFAPADGIGMYDTAYYDPRPNHPGNFGGGYSDNGAAGSSNVQGTPLEDLTKYMSLLGVMPARLNGYIIRWNGDAVPVDNVNAEIVSANDITLGQATFSDIGCADCHRTQAYTTSEFHPLAELRNQTVTLYTDFLLHDMGTGLADNLGEGDDANGGASGAEWLTPSLVGVGSQACATGGSGTYNNGQWDPFGEASGTRPAGQFGEEYCVPKLNLLHDGRARSFDEAILWHGGEGQAAKDAYSLLSQDQKDRLVDFLRAL